MALVVFLRGVNVGGHRRLRPAALATALAHLDAVNIGTAGTLVIRRRVSQARLRAEIRRRLPFDAAMLIVPGERVARLTARDRFAGQRARPDVIRFVGVVAGRHRRRPRLPVVIPSRGPWLVKVLAREGCFVVGLYRRRMASIGALGQLDALFGGTATTRGWTTMETVARVVEGARLRPGGGAC